MSEDVLNLLANQRSQNRANFAESQAAKAEVSANKPKQWTHYGRDADSGTMAIAPDGGDAQLMGSSITNGLMQPGQAVRVNASGNTITVDQKPAPHTQQATVAGSTSGGNVKLLFRIDTAEAVELWVCGWQTEAVLAFTVPKNGTLLFASVDNLGGDDWSLNVLYQIGSQSVLEKVAADDAWQVASPHTLASYGHGFWTTTLSGSGTTVPTGSGTTTSGNSNNGSTTTENGSYSSSSGRLAVQVWQGERSTMPQPDSTSETYAYSRSSYDYGEFTTDLTSATNNFERGQEVSPAWILPELVLTSSSRGDSTYTAQAETHIVSDGVNTISLNGYSMTRSESALQFLEYSPFKINESGAAGLGSRTIENAYSLVTSSYTSSLEGNTLPVETNISTNTYSNQLVWFEGEGVAAVAPEAFTLLNGGYIDVFDEFFTCLAGTSVDEASYTQAFDWDADETFAVSVYSSTFDALEDVEAIVYRASLQYRDNHLPVFYGASYHP